MLYLEDYLEMIEHLPAEVRDSFTQMRELDLSVQNSMDSIDKKVRNFFQQCKRGELTEEEMEEEYKAISNEYKKVREDADEKVNISTNMHELVERYIRRLDSEIFKFKCELEADHKGVTEQLERKVNEQANESGISAALLLGMGQKENRYYNPIGMGTTAGGSTHAIITSADSYTAMPQTPTSYKDNRYKSPRSEKRRESAGGAMGILDKRSSSLATSSQPAAAVIRQVPTGHLPHSALGTAVGPSAVPPPVASGTVAYNLQQLGGPGTNALAAAASQAIVATQQMQQGRRTASLKASYEAINGAGGGPKEFWISRDIASAAPSTAVNTLPTTPIADKKKKKHTSSLQPLSTSPSIHAPSPSSISLSSSSPSLNVDDMLPSVSGGLPSLGGLSGLPSAGSLMGRNTSYTGTATALTPGSNLTINENGMYVEQTGDGEWSYDPNEPRYCICNQVSYGDMVACDNESCPLEWFHYPCVNITQPPKGKWYCPNCTVNMRRRGNRKN